MADRFVSLDATPLAPGASDVRIHVRDSGRGEPLVFLHGGWGYSIYPLDLALMSRRRDCRLVIPDRTGYGRSGAIDVQLSDFHQRAAQETVAVLEALDIERAVLWGHSDGAVIALRMALMTPGRVAGVIAEAAHFFRRKPRSRSFFEMMRDAPDELGMRVIAVLQAEHGWRWRDLVRANGAAWLRIADESPSDAADLYDGSLSKIAVPSLVVHGAKDPRTEPGELEALCATIARGAEAARHPEWFQIALLEAGGHSPHSEQSTMAVVADAACAFLSKVAAGTSVGDAIES